MASTGPLGLGDASILDYYPFASGMICGCRSTAELLEHLKTEEVMELHGTKLLYADNSHTQCEWFGLLPRGTVVLGIYQ